MASRFMRIVMFMRGQDLKAARKLAGESQATFARRLRIHQATLARWEANGVPPGSAEVAVDSLMRELRTKLRGSSRGTTRLPRDAGGG
jgi:DNA-binding transcriptional regulator YiaG